jgi:DNA transformation protein and related proteins
VYGGKGKPVALSYWRRPDRLLDEPDEMVDWSRVALAAALRRDATGTKRKPPKEDGRGAGSGAGATLAARRRRAPP